MRVHGSVTEEVGERGEFLSLNGWIGTAIKVNAYWFLRILQGGLFMLLLKGLSAVGSRSSD